MARTVVFCVPFAGAGASFFRPWLPLAGETIDLTAVQLPGREDRYAEEPCRDVTQAVDGLLPDVLDRAATASRVALFGHSLGAVLAYELAHRLVASGEVTVAALVVSGSPGPWTQRASRASGLPDAEFLSRVQEFAGYRHEAFSDPEMCELLLPSLRADVEMHENYLPSTDVPLDAPITAVRGACDELVTAEEVAQWDKATSREFHLVEIAGGHMYLTEAPRDAVRVIKTAISRH